MASFVPRHFQAFCVTSKAQKGLGTRLSLSSVQAKDNRISPAVVSSYRIAGSFRGRIFREFRRTVTVRKKLFANNDPNMFPDVNVNYNSAKYLFMKITITSHSQKYSTAK